MFPSKWTKEDDAIIISNRNDKKTNKHIETLLEGKSETQVKNNSRNYCRWTKEDDDIIIKNKKEKKTNKHIATLLEGRSETQVKNRSRCLINEGTLKTVAKKCLWTKEEDAIIISNKKDNTTNKDIAMLLEGKTEIQVKNRSRFLINKGTLNPRFRNVCTWTKEEDAIIISNKKDHKTNKDIAMLLEGRSYTQVNNRSSFLINEGTLNPKFQRGCTWTKEEDAIIISNKKDHKTNKDIAMLLEGKTEIQVNNRSSFLINEGTLKTVAKKKKAPVTKVRFHINK
jgi:dUTPase